MNINQSILMLFALMLLFVFNDSAMAQKNYCDRTVAAAPISLPKPQESDRSTFLKGAINKVLAENSAEEES